MPSANASVAQGFKRSSHVFWYSALILMADALQVMDMRLRQLAAGNGTSDETFLMVTEKLEAAAEARTIFYPRWRLQSRP